MQLDNPPAFPDSVAVNGFGGLNYSSEKGMTLRDYFAAAALTSMQAHPANERAPYVASWAYEVADAMLAERAKGGK